MFTKMSECVWVLVLTKSLEIWYLDVFCPQRNVNRFIQQSCLLIHVYLVCHLFPKLAPYLDGKLPLDFASTWHWSFGTKVLEGLLSVSKTITLHLAHICHIQSDMKPYLLLKRHNYPHKHKICLKYFAIILLLDAAETQTSFCKCNYGFRNLHNHWCKPSLNTW